MPVFLAAIPSAQRENYSGGRYPRIEFDPSDGTVWMDSAEVF